MADWARRIASRVLRPSDGITILPSSTIFVITWPSESVRAEYPMGTEMQAPVPFATFMESALYGPEGY